MPPRTDEADFGLRRADAYRHQSEKLASFLPSPPRQNRSRLPGSPHTAVPVRPPVVAMVAGSSSSSGYPAGDWDSHGKSPRRPIRRSAAARSLPSLTDSSAAVHTPRMELCSPNLHPSVTRPVLAQTGQRNSPYRQWVHPRQIGHRRASQTRVPGAPQQAASRQRCGYQSALASFMERKPRR